MFVKIFLQYDWQIDNQLFQKGQSWCVLKSWGGGGGGGGGGVQNKDFGAVSQIDLNAVSSYNMGPSLGRFW